MVVCPLNIIVKMIIFISAICSRCRKSLYAGQNLGSLHHKNAPVETVSVSLHMNVCASSLNLKSLNSKIKAMFILIRKQSIDIF